MTIKKLEESVEIGAFRAAVEGAAALLGFKRQEEDFLGNNCLYQIATKEDYEHRYGDGGHTLHQSELVRVNQSKTTVLESKYYVSWDTTSDDSTDYGSEKEQFTALYEKDPLAKEVFKRLKQVIDEQKRVKRK